MGLVTLQDTAPVPISHCHFSFLGERRNEATSWPQHSIRDCSLAPCPRPSLERLSLKEQGGWVGIQQAEVSQLLVLKWNPAFRVVCFQSCQASLTQIPRKTHPKPCSRKTVRRRVKLFYRCQFSFLWLLQHGCMAKPACKMWSVLTEKETESRSQGCASLY